MTTVLERAVERSRVKDQIRGCTACDLRACNTYFPVPFRGTTPNRLMVLGEAPGFAEMRYGQPFIGEAGQVLAKMLTDSRLPHLENWFIANSASCKPRDGAPDSRHLLACSKNLRDQVTLCDPEWVLALGNTALNTAAGLLSLSRRPAPASEQEILAVEMMAAPEGPVSKAKKKSSSSVGRLQITKLHGRPFVAPCGPMMGRKVFPTFHPAATLRDPSKYIELGSDLDTLRRIIEGESGMLDTVGVRINMKGLVSHGHFGY